MPKINSNSKLNFTPDFRWLCSACLRFERHCRFKRESIQDSEFGPKFELHKDFNELNSCSKNGCRACRNLQLALVQSCYTKAQLKDLCNSENPVFVSSRVGYTGLVRVRTYVESYGDLTQDLGKAFYDWKNGDKERYAQVKKWAITCDEQHPICQELTDPENEPHNPTRLLDLGEEDSDFIKLADSPVERVKYCALTYCWGPDRIRNYKTLEENVERRKLRIELAMLPQTLYDAVIFCRSIGLRYAWIDALCIIQDNADDWNREAVRMHKVYGHAYLTLSPCSAEDPTEGFLQNSPCNIPVCELAGVPLSLSSKSLDDILRNSPVAKRGWTLQEELLSPRILYWTRHGIFWACTNGIKAEDEGDRSTRSPQQFIRTIRDAQRHGGHNLINVWNEVVERYTKCTFSHINDRFPALSGLAAEYHKSEGDDFVAGFWRRSLPGSLLWTVQGQLVSEARPKTVAPSWSWASLPSGQAIRTSRKSAVRVELLQTLIEVENENEFANLKRDLCEDCKLLEKKQNLCDYCKLKQASITLKGCLRPLILADCQNLGKWPSFTIQSEEEVYALPSTLSYAINLTTNQVMIAQGSKKVAVVQLDNMFVSESSVLRSQCLQTDDWSFLLIEKVNETEYYRRIGCCYTHHFMSFFVNTKQEVVTII